MSDSRAQASSVAIVVLATTLMGVLVILAVPGLSLVLPQELEQRLRATLYESWSMFAPPPHEFPTVLARCAEPGSSGSEGTYDVVQCFASEARGQPFGASYTLASYAARLASRWVAGAADVDKLNRLGMSFCGPSALITVSVAGRERDGTYTKIVDVPYSPTGEYVAAIGLDRVTSRACRVH